MIRRGKNRSHYPPFRRKRLGVIGSSHQIDYANYVRVASPPKDPHLFHNWPTDKPLQNCILPVFASLMMELHRPKSLATN